MRYDFLKHDINDWSFEEMTTELAFEHFKGASSVMEWFQTEGKELLEREQPLSYQEWEPLLEQSFLLLRDFSGTRSVKVLFTSVIERGIKDLAAYAVEHPSYEAVRGWFVSLDYQLHTGRLGVGSRHCSVEKSRALIDGMVRIAQIVKSKGLLQMAAERRYSHDQFACKAFSAHHLTWEEAEVTTESEVGSSEEN